jgi:hypothetical protein
MAQRGLTVFFYQKKIKSVFKLCFAFFGQNQLWILEKTVCTFLAYLFLFMQRKNLNLVFKSFNANDCSSDIRCMKMILRAHVIWSWSHSHFFWQIFQKFSDYGLGFFFNKKTAPPPFTPVINLLNARFVSAVILFQVSMY